MEDDSNFILLWIFDREDVLRRYHLGGSEFYHFAGKGTLTESGIFACLESFLFSIDVSLLKILSSHLYKLH